MPGAVLLNPGPQSGYHDVSGLSRSRTPTVDGQKYPWHNERAKSPVAMDTPKYRSRSPAQELIASRRSVASTNGFGSTPPGYGSRPVTPSGEYRAKQEANRTPATLRSSGRRILPRPQSTPPDVRLNVDYGDPKNQDLVKDIPGAPRRPESRTMDPRMRYSMADLQTLLRRGDCYGSGSSLRRNLSGSLQDTLATAGMDSSGASPTGLETRHGTPRDGSDSGLGEDLWVQYRARLQEKKRRILEEHTTWVNSVLTSHGHSRVDDLCRSVADGVTMATILNILTSSPVPLPHASPSLTIQQTDNLQRCLDHLDIHGVDTQGLDSADLANGHLKSTLVLMNNLRRKYEPPSPYISNTPSAGDRDSTRAPSGHTRYSNGGERGVTPTLGGQPPRGATPTMGGPHRATTPVQRQDYAPPLPQKRHSDLITPPSDLLPGTISHDKPPTRPQPAQTGSVSTTELYHDSVIQRSNGSHGNGEQRSLASQQIKVPSKVKSSTNNSRHGYRPQEPSPGPAVQAWGQSSTNHSTGQPKALAPNPGSSMAQQGSRSSNQPAQQSVRLSNGHHGNVNGFGNHTTGGVINSGYVLDDGELIIPPPKPREERLTPRDKSGYVPSQPSDPTRMQPHTAPLMSNGSAPPTYHPPPQYNRQSGQPPLHRDDNNRQSSNLRPPSQPQSRADNSSNRPPSQPQALSAMHHIGPNGHPGQHHGGPSGPQGLSSLQQRGPSQSQGPSQPHGERPGGHNAGPGRTLQTQKDDSHNSQYTRQRSSLSTTPQSNLSGGRTSPQGQSSTPASQSPNHDKAGMFGSRNYVNINGLPATKSHPATTAQDKDVIGPSSVYPTSASYLSSETLAYNSSQIVNSPQVPNKLDAMYNITSSSRTKGQSVNKGWNSPRQKPDSKNPASSGVGHIEMQQLRNSSRWKNTDLSQAAEDAWRRSPTKGDQWEDTSDGSSITPPLPALSPSNTPPVTPPISPMKGPRTKAETTKPGGGHLGLRVRKGRRPMSAESGAGRRQGEGWRRPGGRNTAAYRSPGRAVSRPHGSADDLSGSSTAGSLSDTWEDTMDGGEVRRLRQQMEGLESMYTEVLKMVGLDREYMTPGSRRSVSSMSSVSRSGVSRSRSRAHMNAHRANREIRQMSKRFSRLESHVVTLARSVAHLSSEMRAQNSLFTEVEDLRKEVKQMKKDRHHPSHPHGAGNHDNIDAVAGGVASRSEDFERFRGWIPSITNPKRVQKLAKFFGQDRLLHYFLEKLGYQKYIKNFEKEEITILELPYMNEDRLQKLGIPMGPRQRILQEAQLCFRQENFSIYIV